MPAAQSTPLAYDGLVRELPPDHDPSLAPSAQEGDRFPTGELLALVGRLRAYPVLAYRLASDPGVPPARRAAVLGAAAYMVSPIDAVPGFIPLVGQLDDIAVALLAIHVALRGLDDERQREHLSAVGLDAAVLDRDLETVRRASAWLVRRGARVGAAAARVGGRIAVAGARVGIRAGSAAGARGLEVGRGIAARAGSVRSRAGETRARQGATAAAGAARAGAGAAAGAARAGAGAAGRGASVARDGATGMVRRGRSVAGTIRARVRPGEHPADDESAESTAQETRRQDAGADDAEAPGDG